MPRLSIALMALATAAVAFGAKTLDIFVVDTEGGQATLVVAPSGQSLLIGAGSAGFSGRDADRIRAAAKAGGVKHLDYLLLTSFEKDRAGGVPNLLERLPVATFLDIGPESAYPDPYKTAIEKGTHKLAGDTIALKGLDKVKVVNNCLIAEFGKFRFADFADGTCPPSEAGKLDVYLTSALENESTGALQELTPRVAIINNSAHKGADSAAWKRIRNSPRLEDVWQVHFALAGGKETNTPDPMIANIDDGAGNYLKVSASADGSFTVFNSRNKYTKMY
jgi:competence protein ComEC